MFDVVLIGAYVVLRLIFRYDDFFQFMSTKLLPYIFGDLPRLPINVIITIILNSVLLTVT